MRKRAPEHAPVKRRRAPGAGRHPSEDREIALITGEKTYLGTMHAQCGTTERYTKGGGCAHCARVIATEQREARKYLKAQASIATVVEQTVEEDREEPFNDVTAQFTEPLDSDEEMALGDAKAREQSSIDDLM